MAVSVMLSIYDRKTRAFGAPGAFVSVGDALRALVVGVERAPESLYRRFPADYAVHEVGSWDSSTGTFVPLARPVLVAEMSDVVASMKEESK